MRRLFKTMVILGFVFIPLIAAAVEITSPITPTTIPELVETITNYAFWLGMMLAPLMILWGAFTFMTAAGNPEKIKTGGKIIFWTIVGLAVILFSRIIISIVKAILTG